MVFVLLDPRRRPKKQAGSTLENVAEDVLSGLFCHYEPPTTTNAQNNAVKEARSNPSKYTFSQIKRKKSILRTSRLFRKKANAVVKKKKGVTWRDEATAAEEGVESQVEACAVAQCDVLGLSTKGNGLADSLSPTAEQLKTAIVNPFIIEKKEEEGENSDKENTPKEETSKKVLYDDEGNPLNEDGTAINEDVVSAQAQENARNISFNCAQTNENAEGVPEAPSGLAKIRKLADQLDENEARRNNNDVYEPDDYDRPRGTAQSQEYRRVQSPPVRRRQTPRNQGEEDLIVSTRSAESDIIVNSRSPSNADDKGKDLDGSGNVAPRARRGILRNRRPSTPYRRRGEEEDQDDRYGAQSPGRRSEVNSEITMDEAITERRRRSPAKVLEDPDDDSIEKEEEEMKNRRERRRVKSLDDDDDDERYSGRVKKSFDDSDEDYTPRRRRRERKSFDEVEDDESNGNNGRRRVSVNRTKSLADDDSASEGKSLDDGSGRRRRGKSLDDEGDDREPPSRKSKTLDDDSSDDSLGKNSNRRRRQSEGGSLWDHDDKDIESSVTQVKRKSRRSSAPIGRSDSKHADMEWASEDEEESPRRSRRSTGGRVERARKDEGSPRRTRKRDPTPRSGNGEQERQGPLPPTPRRKDKGRRSSKDDYKPTKDRSSRRSGEYDRMQQQYKNPLSPKSYATDDEIRAEVSSVGMETTTLRPLQPNPFLNVPPAVLEEDSSVIEKNDNVVVVKRKKKATSGSKKPSSQERAEPPKPRNVSTQKTQKESSQIKKSLSDEEQKCIQASSSGSESVRTKKLWKGWKKAVGKVKSIVKDIDEQRLPNPTERAHLYSRE